LHETCGLAIRKRLFVIDFTIKGGATGSPARVIGIPSLAGIHKT
jgi:hypothetical protein